MKVLSFASLAYENKKKKTRREKLLEEMKQTKKGNQWYFGMKAHVGTDTGKRLAHSVVVTHAAVHDSQVMDKLLHGEEEAVYGDKAYASEERKVEYESRGIEWCVKKKANRGKQLTEQDKEYNHRQGKIRAKVEHAFLVVKHIWQRRKVRYKGLYKKCGPALQHVYAGEPVHGAARTGNSKGIVCPVGGKMVKTGENTRNKALKTFRKTV